MLHATFYQTSWLRVNPDTIGLSQSSFERRLPEVIGKIVSIDDFVGFYDESSDGGPSCCPLVLISMLILKFFFGESDEGIVTRCKRDLGCRYALQLEAGQQPPSVTSLKRFRRKLREIKGEDFIFRATVQLANSEGLLDDCGLQGVDSTDTSCRGAVTDTFNLVAGAIRHVLKRVADLSGVSTLDLAKRWGFELYMNRSIKGQADIDWSDEKARNVLLTREIQDADRLEGLIKELNLPAEVEEAVELLRQVARQDVEQVNDGTYRIKRGTAAGRIISITDPEARHGRKSSSKVINGFKTHLIGTIGSQFVTGVKVTDAGIHDAQVTPELIEQAANNNVKPKQLLGDGAYGAGENIRKCREKGVELLCKMPTPSHKGSLPKRDFEIDIDAMRISCPAGHTTEKYTLVNGPGGADQKVAKFHFDKETCATCELSKLCCQSSANGGHRTLTLSIHEEELQRIKAFNQSPGAKDLLRQRSAIERLISHVVRLGMRCARFFSMKMVQFQAYMVAATYNLKRYIRLTTLRRSDETA